MDLLSHLQTVLASSGVSSHLFSRTDGRGADITIRSFETQKLYGRQLRKIQLKCSLTLVGEVTSSEDLFSLLEDLTFALNKDQTVGGDYSAINIGPWNNITAEKNYLVFETIISVEE